MMRSCLLTLALALGCSKSAPTPQPPAQPPPPSTDGTAMCGMPNQGTAMTPEQCECLGGRLNASRGGEQEHCAASEREIGPVRFGIEGGWCCKAQ